MSNKWPEPSDRNRRALLQGHISQPDDPQTSLSPAVRILPTHVARPATDQENHDRDTRNDWSRSSMYRRRFGSLKQPVMYVLPYSFATKKAGGGLRRPDPRAPSGDPAVQTLSEIYGPWVSETQAPLSVFYKTLVHTGPIQLY